MPAPSPPPKSHDLGGGFFDAETQRGWLQLVADSGR